jgi:hypothetical protein
MAKITLSLAFAVLLSLFILPSTSAVLPPIIVTNITSQCPGPTITITLQSVTAGSWLLPTGNPDLYVHFDPVSTAPPPLTPGIQWGSAGWVPPFGNPQTYTIGASLSPGPHSLQLTASASPTIWGAASAIYTFTVPNCGSSGGGKGMTWLHTKSNAQTGTITVGCSGCDAGHGDTVCTQQLPVLCIYKPKPLFQLPLGLPNSDRYNLWSGGVVATTQPVAGNTFAHIADANSYCVAQFGPGWRVAEFHDGWGWNFQAYGGTVSAPTVPSTRFWVHINDQKAANCWATP